MSAPARRLAFVGLALTIAGCGRSGVEGRSSQTTAAAAPASQPQGAANESAKAHDGLSSGASQAQPAQQPGGDISVRVADRPALDALLAQLRGKVVLVDFWATWCVPCVEQFPHTVQLHRRHAGKGLAVISVSVDDVDNLDQVRRFLAKQGATFDNLLGSAGGSAETFGAFELQAVPHYRVYDREGKLRHTFAVDPSADRQFTLGDIEKAVASLLEQRAS